LFHQQNDFDTKTGSSGRISKLSQRFNIRFQRLGLNEYKQTINY